MSWGIGIAVPKGERRQRVKARQNRQQVAAHRAVYAAVTARDKGCRICGRRWGLHRHHLVFRSQGGPTTTANVILVCDVHHAAVHARRLTILGTDADNGLAFKTRDVLR